MISRFEARLINILDAVSLGWRDKFVDPIDAVAFSFRERLAVRGNLKATNQLTPNPICFLDVKEREHINWKYVEQDKQDEEYAKSYDWNVADYEVVDQYTKHEDEYDTYDVRIIHRISDDTYWAADVHVNSWSDMQNGWWGGRGSGSYQVVGTPIQKMEWKAV